MMIHVLMYISWLGQSAFKIEFRTPTSEGLILLDPYRTEKEEMPRSFTPDIVLLTRGEENIITISKEPFVISEPGEFEYKEVLVYGFATTPQKNAPLIFRMEVEHVTIAHLGLLGAPPTDDILNELNGVDILLTPIGGNGVLGGERAAEIVTGIEPRIVIPYAYKASSTGAEYNGPETFIKAIGAEPEKTQKIKITKKDLPSDKLLAVLLEKQ